MTGEPVSPHLTSLPWTVRDQLLLCDMVQKYGNQSWPLISRHMKAETSNDANPDEWYSARQCARQYSEMTETVPQPRSRRGVKDVEAPEVAVTRKMRQQRIDQLVAAVDKDEDTYAELMREVDQIKAGDRPFLEASYQGLLAWQQREKEYARIRATRRGKLSSRASRTSHSQPSSPSIATPVRTKSGNTPLRTMSGSSQPGSAARKGAGQRRGRLASTEVPSPTAPSPARATVLDSAEAATEATAPRSSTSLASEATAQSTSADKESLKSTAVGDSKMLSEGDRVADTADGASTTAQLHAPDDGNGVDGQTDGHDGNNAGNSNDGSVAKVEPTIGEKVDGVSAGKSPQTGDEDAKEEASSGSRSRRSRRSRRAAASRRAGSSSPRRHVESRSAPESDVDSTAEESGRDDDASASERSRTSSPAPRRGRPRRHRKSALSKEATTPAQAASSSSTRRGRRHTQANGTEADSDGDVATDAENGNADHPASKDAASSGRRKTSLKDAKPEGLRISVEELDDDEPLLPKKSASKPKKNLGPVIIYGYEPPPFFGVCPDFKEEWELPAASRDRDGANDEDDGDDDDDDEELTPEDVEARQRSWRSAILSIWRQIAGHKGANLFSHPVRADQVPEYYEVVKKPMDLATIEHMIKNQELETTREFELHMMQMLANATLFNPKGHFVHESAVEMKADAIRAIEAFKLTMQAPDSSPPDRSTRGRRTRRGTDDSADTGQRKKRSKSMRG